MVWLSVFGIFNVHTNVGVCDSTRYFRVSKQWYGCQCLGFLTYTRTLVYAIARGIFVCPNNGMAVSVWDF